MLIFGDLTLDFNSNSTLPPKKTVTALFCLWRLATVAANQGKPEDGSGSRRCSRDWQSNTLFLFSATKMAQWFNLFEKYVRQIGSFPQVRVKIKNIGNHHPDCLRFEGKCWSLSTQSVDRVDGFHSRIPQIQDYSRKNLQNPRFKQHPTYVFTKFQLPNPKKKLIFEKPLPLVALL